MRDSDPGLFISRPSENETAQFLANLQFAAAVFSLNGDIFWAPASKSNEIVTNFGDEARAVFSLAGRAPADLHGRARLATTTSERV